jgi:hypothetical protein
MVRCRPGGKNRRNFQISAGGEGNYGKRPDSAPMGPSLSSEGSVAEKTLTPQSWRSSALTASASVRLRAKRSYLCTTSASNLRLRAGFFSPSLLGGFPLFRLFFAI